jgi:hypothetical protein
VSFVALAHPKSIGDAMDRKLVGKRCRTVRPIMHHAGAIPRESTGVVRYAMENLGRRLVHIDLDSGRSLVLLADEIAVDGECPDSAA